MAALSGGDRLHAHPAAVRIGTTVAGVGQEYGDCLPKELVL